MPGTFPGSHPDGQLDDWFLTAAQRDNPATRLDTRHPAARRGVAVRGLVWRSHLDWLQFSGHENRHLGEAIDVAGGQCLLDMRVRPGGSHHMKLVVLRHAGSPDRDVAFVGGIDPCHSRRDDAAHQGDPQRQPMAAVYGDHPPWHDVQLMISGPAVGDLETVFRERWEDPAPRLDAQAGGSRMRYQTPSRGSPCCGLSRPRGPCAAG
jgi:phosphatidylserine/phosphatidylglycerophosphate/cardiolipin synthase-like enzyme